MKRILWIGDRQHPELIDAWNWIDRSGGCHFAQSIHEAISLALRGITQVIIARPSRMVQPTDLFNRLLQQYPLARFVVISGSLGDGEQRTGTPWIGCQHIAWHRAAYHLARATMPDPHRSDSPLDNQQSEATAAWCEPMGPIGIVSRTPSINQGLAEALRHAGYSVANVPVQQLKHVGPLRHIFWDDSLIRDAQSWQSLSSIHRHSTIRCQQTTASRDATQHHWLVSAPDVRSWHALKQCGFTSLHSKPYDFDWVLHNLTHPVTTHPAACAVRL